MNTKDLASKMYDECLRVDQLFLLSASAIHGNLPDGLEEFFSNESESNIKKMFGKHPEWVDLDDPGTVSAWLAESGHTGFLAQFATPVMTPTGGVGRSYSWGYFRTEWFYAQTLEELMNLGFKWSRGQRDAEDKKAKKPISNKHQTDAYQEKNNALRPSRP